MASDIRILIVTLAWTLYCFAMPAEAPICRALPECYAAYNHNLFADSLPKADVAYGSCPIRNVVACSWMENGHAYIRLIPKYNLAPDGAHFTLLHEMCHLSVYGLEFADHGPKWQACMHRLADAKAFEGLW